MSAPRIRCIALLALAVLATLPAPRAMADPLAVCAVSNGQVAEYDILRGGNVIGRQTVRYAVSGPDMTVTIDVHAALRAVGIRVYNYDHHGEEKWHAGQMVALATRTDDDGTPRTVDATRDAAGSWHGTTGPAPGPAPLLATSLWNSLTVAQTRLLDRETGAIVAVRAAPAPDETLTLGGRAVPAHKFDLTGLVSGTVWYDRNGCWLQALFHTRVDGSLVQVRAR